MPAESDIAGKHVLISYIFELEPHLQTAATWKEKTWICPGIDPRTIPIPAPHPSSGTRGGATGTASSSWARPWRSKIMELNGEFIWDMHGYGIYIVFMWDFNGIYVDVMWDS